MTMTAFMALTLVEPGLRLDTGGVARAAEARPPRRVALFVMPEKRGGAGEAKVLQSLMREELRKLRGVVAVGANGDPGESASQAIGPSVEAGFRALNDRDGAKAEQAFKKAYDAISTYRGPLDKRLMARILKGYGVASAMTGRASNAEQMMSASLNVWPDQQASEYGWTLDTRSAFREVERTHAEAAPGSVELSSDPDGAEVRIDGDLKGFTPLTVEGLAPGLHWVEATIDGYYRGGQFVAVPAGDSSLAHVPLDPVPNQRTIDAAQSNVQRLIRGPQVASPLGDLKRLAGADVILVFEVDKVRGSYDLSGWMMGGGATPTRVGGTYPEDGNLLSSLQTMIAKALATEAGSDDEMLALDGPPQASVMDGGEIYIDPNDPIFKEEKKKEGESITDKWWFWTIAGGAAVALVVGGVLLFSGGDEGSGPAGNVVLDLHKVQ
ncbi:MAG: PEGA domain-containing protein [Myxococcales bacterium]|nr:PEGA domain-containing protein [Myxococcales bacterium]MCB9733497.1 PEGA domain-containing protein [Deltaproteobacteria bacterium]